MYGYYPHMTYFKFKNMLRIQNSKRGNESGTSKESWGTVKDHAGL